jgi:hypothetical protein
MALLSVILEPAAVPGVASAVGQQWAAAGADLSENLNRFT